MRKYAYYLLLAPFLVSCGGGGGSSSGTEATTLTGQFIDSPVAGLKYSTDSLSGTTDANGNFTYLAGEYIQFEMGGLSIGGAPAKAVLTPYDVTLTNLSPDTAALNLTRLLLTLDNDNNPDNGITLKAEAALLGAANLSDTTALKAALAAALPGATLVASSTAAQHLDNTLTTVTSTSPMPDGTYSSLLVMNSKDSACTNTYQSASLSMSKGVVTGGSLTRADGTVETLGQDSTGKLVSTNGSQVTALRLYSGSLTGPGLTVEDTAYPLSTTAGTHSYCWARFTLKQEGAANESPMVYQPMAKREGICQLNDPNQPHNITFNFSALDRDGYFSSKMLFSYTVDGKTPVNLIGGWQSPWDDSNKNNRLSDEFTISKLCGQGVDWNVAVTDNDGAVTQIKGRLDAQVQGTAPTGGGGTAAVCLENYPSQACNILQSNNASTTSHPAGSCNSLIPNPAVVIDVSSQPSSTDPRYAQFPQIQVYPAASGTVSCYFEAVP